MKQLGLWPAVGMWAAFCLGGALYASWLGYGGKAFAATLTTFAFLLLVTLVMAARGVAEGIAAKFGAGGGWLLGACVLLADTVYWWEPEPSRSDVPQQLPGRSLRPWCWPRPQAGRAQAHGRISLRLRASGCL